MALRQVDLNSGMDIKKLNELADKLNNLSQQQADAEQKLYDARMQNIEREYDRRVELQKELLQMGLADIQKEAAAKEKQRKKELSDALKEAKKKYGGTSSAEYKALEAQLNAEYKLREEREKKLLAKKAKWAEQYQKDADRRANLQKHHENGKALFNGLFGSGNSFQQRLGAVRSAFHDSTGNYDLGKGLNAIVAGVSDLAKQLEQKVDTIASKKGAIDTRLQGSKNKKMFGLGGGSYWDQMSYDIMGIAGVSPYIKQENVVGNLESLVGKGIAYNVEQRAFLATIADKIATTFNAADGTLLRLVRIQQQDSTAGRLGMESMMTAFLNNMYETTEYLNDIASSVRSSLDEVESLMGAADAVALEYQVQKWMGSLYSVGMSSRAVGGIAQAFGQLAAGDISGLTGGGMGNLMIMAANQAGLSIADILAEGLDDSNTNRLMAAMVEYLQQIASDSSDSRVVQQQIAKVYGLTASDLRAATNMRSSMGATYNSSLNYGGAIGRLNSMANSMYARTSMGEMMSNVWDNFQYTMAAGMASNPVTYLLYKTASLLDSVAGGIALPDIKVMGSGVNLQTTVADLMRVASMSGGIMAGLGSMISNLSAGGGFSGSGMLKALGISGNMNAVARGGGGVAYTPISGGSVSESGTFRANGAGNEIQEQTMANAADTQKSKMAEAQESEENDLMNRDLNDSILKIYDLLQGVINGSEALTVRPSYGSVWGANGVGGIY